MSQDTSHADSPEQSHHIEEYEENSYDYSDITSTASHVSQLHQTSISRKLKARPHEGSLSSLPMDGVLQSADQQISLTVTVSSPPHRSPQQQDVDLTSEDVSVNVDSAPMPRHYNRDFSGDENLGIPHAISTPALSRLRRQSESHSSNYSPSSNGSTGTPIDNTNATQPSSGIAIEDSLTRLKNNTKHGITEAQAKK
jgi:hypothetical protein